MSPRAPVGMRITAPFDQEHCLCRADGATAFLFDSPQIPPQPHADMIFPGEAFAVLAAVFFAASGVTVAKGAGHGGGDHGALLSIILTAFLAALFWLPTASFDRLPDTREA